MAKSKKKSSEMEIESEKMPAEVAEIKRRENKSSRKLMKRSHKVQKKVCEK